MPSSLLLLFLSPAPFLLFDILTHPLHAHFDAFPGGCGARLDLPRPVGDGLESHALGDGVRLRGTRQVLLVGEDQERDAHQLVLAKQLLVQFRKDKDKVELKGWGSKFEK